MKEAHERGGSDSRQDKSHLGEEGQQRTDSCGCVLGCTNADKRWVPGCHGRAGWDSNPWHVRAGVELTRGSQSRAKHHLASCFKVPNTIFNYFPLIWQLVLVLNFNLHNWF